MKINTKNKLLIAAIALLLFLSYKLAIQKTILIKKEYNELNINLKEVAEIPTKLKLLKKKNTYFDSLLSKVNFANTSFQNNLLRKINTEALQKNVNVIEFNEPHNYTIEDNKFLTYSFRLKGGYTKILKVINRIEKAANYGEVVHIDFEKKRNYRTRRNSLEATILIQNVK